VPRSITLLENESLLCIGDDGNRRILCYPIENDPKNNADDFLFVITHPKLDRIFAIDHIGKLRWHLRESKKKVILYLILGDTLFALVQPNDQSSSPQIQAFNVRSRRLVHSWTSKKGLIDPHDICVSKDRKSIYVCDLSLKAEKRIYKFSSESKAKVSKIYDKFKEKSNSNFKSSQKQEEKKSLYSYNLSKNWPISDQNFGQIVAVDIDKDGNVVIFHRGTHVWDQR